MKQVSVFCCLFILIFSCQREDEIEFLSGKVRFSIGEIKKKQNHDGREKMSIPANIFLSVEDENGLLIIDNELMQLFDFGSGYMSEPMELKPGAYSLTMFTILDGERKVIYATPVEGSAKAKYVDDPLPLYFSVSENNTTQVVPQVLEVDENDTPESFGYVSFSYEIIDLPSESIGILVDMKFMIGDLLYEKIGADIVITGYDQDEASWVKKYENVQPKDILQVDMSYDHYKIEMFKWGMYDKREFSKQWLWEGRADGPFPETYGFGGVKSAQKLAEEVTYYEYNGNFIEDNKITYSYSEDSLLQRMDNHNYNSELGQYEISNYYEFTYFDDPFEVRNDVDKIIRYNNDGSNVLEEFHYTYNGNNSSSYINYVDQIVYYHGGSGLNTILSFTIDFEAWIINAEYSTSNGKSFTYRMTMDWKNIISDEVIDDVVCNEGVYEYDQGINPFRHLGFLNFYLNNLSVNNKTIEDKNYYNCSFPTLIPKYHEYEYDIEGYPLKKITTYEDGLRSMTIFKYN